MNHFTKLSIELANQRDYLDQLFRVYPLSPSNIRYVDNELWEKIEFNYKQGKNTDLIESLLDLKLFPIKDGYVPYLRRDRDAAKRNPETVDRICGRIRSLGIDELYKMCTQPKETNRQMGPLFHRWLSSGSLGKFPVSEEEFLSNKSNAILAGSDASLAAFAKKYLGYTREKGIDFLARWNGRYVIGEAKFISDEGGHQNDQFLDAVTTIGLQGSDDVIYIGIIDGVIYIPSNKKIYKTITENDMPIMSALVLREFLYSL